MRKYLFLIFVIFIIFNITSCEWLDPAEQVPSYLQIDEVDLNVRPGEGSASHAINTVWVYIDGTANGVYELPAKVPLLYEGKHELIIMPGIKLNGITTTRAVYPFYDNYVTQVTFVPDSITKVKPVFNYMDGINFHFIEDFETAGTIFNSSPTSDTTIITTDNDDDVFEGVFSGIISLTDTEDSVFIYTINSYSLDPGFMHFLELNYKSTEHLTIGVNVYTNTGPLTYPYIVLKPTSEWKKIYINLTPLATRYGATSSFIIYFSSEKTSNNVEGKILLDNIKLISSQ
ncbi:MAG TPA: hypothetical protein PLE59_02610 [Bacteroidales bacterium]|nr:hypothetical protein [Bacteroidales bacterium]